MKVSMNGLRSSLTHAANTLAKEISDVLADSNNFIQGYQKEALIEAFGDLAQEIGCLNLVYSLDDNSFTDMSTQLRVTGLAQDDDDGEFDGGGASGAGD